MHRRTAVLVDGGFFRKRHLYTFGPLPANPADLADTLYQMALAHVYDGWGSVSTEHDRENALYRIFYYDCPPLTKKIFNPISRTPIDMERTTDAIYMKLFFEELKQKRKMALRMGTLAENREWVFRPGVTKELLSGKRRLEDLKENDVTYAVRQKGVDMKIGVDIASLALKKQVGRIILVAGDADFVPAAKLARREGIDFVLDSMWNPIHAELFEHIDGLQTKCPKPSD